MRKVLLVDDDYFVRLDLKQLVDWQALGLQIVGEAVNGEEAVRMIDEYQPDIVILDLEMPKMDGLSVLASIKERNQSVMPIVLSCHEDFDNVKEAMRLGAFDYILKHKLNEDDLLLVVKKVIAAIDDREKKLLQDEGIRKSAKRKRLIDILEGFQSFDSDNMEFMFDATEKECRYVLFVVQVDDSHLMDQEVLSLFRQKVLNHNDRSQNSLVFWSGENLLIGIGSYQKERASFTVYNKLMAEIGIYKKYLEGESTLSVSLSSLFEVNDDISSILRAAKENLLLKYYLGNYALITEVDVLPFQNREMPFDPETMLKQAVYGKDDALTKMTVLLKGLQDNHIHPSVVRQIHLVLVETLKSYNSVLPEDIEALKNCEILESMIEVLSKTVERIRRVESANKSNGSGTLAANIKAFVEMHIQEEITLGMIAEALYLSPGHISSVFKLETGKTVVEYINDYRIDMAKEMLSKSDAKVYEIAEEVGIPNYRYFTRVFKQREGITPSDYQKHIRNVTN